MPKFDSLSRYGRPNIQADKNPSALIEGAVQPGYGSDTGIVDNQYAPEELGVETIQPTKISSNYFDQFDVPRPEFGALQRTQTGEPYYQAPAAVGSPTLDQTPRPVRVAETPDEFMRRMEAQQVQPSVSQPARPPLPPLPEANGPKGPPAASGAATHQSAFDGAAEPFIYVPGMVPKVTQELTPSFAAKAVTTTTDVVKDIAKGVFKESPRAVVRGVLEAADNTASAADSLADWLNTNVADLKIDIPSSGISAIDAVGGAVLNPLETISGALHAATNYISKPDSVTGRMIEGTAQFLVGFVPAVRLLRATGVSNVAIQSTAAASASSFLTQNPEEGGLSNLIQQFPALSNPVTQFLAVDPNDPQALNRLKHGIEMAGFGLLTEGIVRGIRFLANTKRASSATGALNTQDTIDGLNMAQSLDAMGSPTQPLVVVSGKQVKPIGPSTPAGGASRALGQAAADTATGVPDAVTANAIVKGAKDQVTADAIVAGMKDETATLIPLVDKSAEGAVSHVKPNGNQVYINLGRIETGDDVKAMIQQVADAMAPQVTAAKRGVQTLAETSRLADNLGLTAEQLMARPKGAALNAEQIVAANRIMTTSAETLWGLAEKAASSNATLADAYNFRKMFAVHHAIEMATLGANAEAGRALSALRIARTSSGARMANQMREILDQLGGENITNALAQRMMALREQGVGVGGLNAAAKRGWMATTSDMMRESYQLGLLWRPKTHLRNFTSNLIASGQQSYERFAAVQIDRLMGTPVNEAVASGEAMAYVYGQIEAIKDMLGLAGRAIARGVGLSDEPIGVAVRKFRDKYPVHISDTSKMQDVRPGAISSATIARERGLQAAEATAFTNSPLGQFVDFVGAATRIPGKALGAGDFLYKTLGYSGEIHAQALRTATQEGLTGVALRNRVADLIANVPEGVRSAAIDQATYVTFNQRAGEVAQSLMKIRNYGGILNPSFLVLTYLRTPSNILRYTANRSPLAMLSQHWWDDIAAGGARRSLALSRMATGTAIMAAAIDYASSALVTGPGPSDAARRGALLRTGWQPYSVYIPGAKMYVSYNNMDPMTQPFSFGATVAEMIKESDLSPEKFDSFEEIFANAIGAVSTSVIDKSYFSSISRFVGAIKDSSQGRAGSVENYMLQQAGSLVPFTSVSSGINDAMDPTRRQAANLWEAIYSQLPGLRAGLIPARDVWGTQIKPQAVYGQWYDFVSPFTVTKDTNSATDHELVRLQTGVQNIPWKSTFMGVHVNFHDYPKVLDEYRVLAGNALKDANGMGAKEYLDAIISGKDDMSQIYQIYSDGPDGGKASFIKNIVGHYRTLAQEAIMATAEQKYPDFYAYILSKKNQKQELKMPVMPGTQQPTAVSQ